VVTNQVGVCAGLFFLNKNLLLWMLKDLFSAPEIVGHFVGLPDLLPGSLPVVVALPPSLCVSPTSKTLSLLGSLNWKYHKIPSCQVSMWRTGCSFPPAHRRFSIFFFVVNLRFVFQLLDQAFLSGLGQFPACPRPKRAPVFFCWGDCLFTLEWLQFWPF